MAKMDVSKFFDRVIHVSNQEVIGPNEMSEIRSLLAWAQSDDDGKKYASFTTKILKAMQNVVDSRNDLDKLTVELEEVAIKANEDMKKAEKNESVKSKKKMIKEDVTVLVDNDWERVEELDGAIRVLVLDDDDVPPVCAIDDDGAVSDTCPYLVGRVNTSCSKYKTELEGDETTSYCCDECVAAFDKANYGREPDVGRAPTSDIATYESLTLSGMITEAQKIYKGMFD